MKPTILLQNNCKFTKYNFDVSRRQTNNKQSRPAAASMLAY